MDFAYELDLTEGGRSCPKDEPANDDALGRRGLDDMKRALGASDAMESLFVFRMCTERLLRIWGEANETDDTTTYLDRLDARCC